MNLEEPIDKQRKENKDNPNYPVMFWVGDKLQVTIGDRVTVCTKEEALEKFKTLPFFQSEYDYLMEESSIPSFSIKSVAPSLEKEIPISEVERRIDEEIQKIIDGLGLVPTEDPEEQLETCCKVQAYIAQNNVYTDTIMMEKVTYPVEQVRIRDLYNAVVKKQGVCTSNSIEFQEITTRLGIQSECVGLKTKPDNDFHMANLVALKGKYYYFDSTLERSVFKIHAQPGQAMILCCAGLGKNPYEKWYEPQCVLPLNPLDSVKPVPANIAQESFTIDQMNSFKKSDSKTPPTL